MPNPVMSDAGDAATSGAGAGAGVVHLADDGVLGADRSCHGGNRIGDGGMTGVRPDRLQSRWRVGQYHLRIIGEKVCNGIELPVIDPGGVTVHEVAERRPVVCAERHAERESRWAQAESSSLARSRSVIGGIVSTTRSAP